MEDIRHYCDSVILVPTLYCSQACAHCCRSAGPWRTERMRRETALRTGYLLDAWRACNIAISGGEPLLMSWELWQRVLFALPHELEGIYIASNGDFLKNPRALYTVLHRVLPALAGQMRDSCEGITIEISNDQFHNFFDAEAWELFKATVNNPYEYARSDNDQILRLDNFDKIYFGTLYKGIAGDTPYDALFPTGRALDFYESGKTVYCEYEINNGYAAHSMTIYPDGSVRGCCNGGPKIGTIYDNPDELMVRHHNFVTAVRERYGYKDSAPSEACLSCAQIARAMRRE